VPVAEEIREKVQNEFIKNQSKLDDSPFIMPIQWIYFDGEILK